MGGNQFFVLGGGLAAVILLIAWLTVASSRRSLVRQSSRALQELQVLNADFASAVAKQRAIEYHWRDAVSSKAKFDRYDLSAFFLNEVLLLENELDHELTVRNKALLHYRNYEGHFHRLGETALGATQSTSLSQESFNAIERKLFERGKLKEPTRVARVRCTVTYTSAGGQNSYAKSLERNFEQLQQGLAQARAIRAQKATTQALRQQERNRMTDRLRAQVLHRDGSRCRMCGATAQDGVRLHVDHIIAVSRGGRTTLENLQTLCQACNLGKSNVL